MSPFSVLMSVYDGEQPAFLRECFESLLAQTRHADEVVIVQDGVLRDELAAVISQYSGRLPICLVRLETNMGLGLALREGVLHCSHDLVARMDSDDLCVPERFQWQLELLDQHPEIDVLGGSIQEFASDPFDCLTERSMPAVHDEIAARAAVRNPMNHMTVMFRKSAVLNAGNYSSFQGLEDYHLWIRMICNGARFHNLPQVLVLARAGTGMLGRRGGWDYLRREAALFWSFRQMGFIGSGRLIANLAVRVPARLMPVFLRGHFYRAFLRTQVN